MKPLHMLTATLACLIAVLLLSGCNTPLPVSQEWYADDPPMSNQPTFNQEQP